MTGSDVPLQPLSYAKGDIEDMLDVAELLGIEFDPDALSSRDPEQITQAEAHMMAEIVKSRIHEGWMREMVRQQKKAGRHGGR